MFYGQCNDCGQRWGLGTVSTCVCERGHTTEDEALKLLLEGAANYIDVLGGDSRKYRQALAAQPAVQEPVAWVTGFHAGRCVIKTINPAAILPVGVALYTTPPAQPAPVQEPVAVARVDDLERGGRVRALAMSLALDAPLYTTPQPQEFVCSTGLCHYKAQRQWVGLTDEEMYLNCPNWLSQEQCKVWVAQIEAKLKEKNNG